MIVTVSQEKSDETRDMNLEALDGESTEVFFCAKPQHERKREQ